MAERLRVHALFRLPELDDLPGVSAIEGGDTVTVDDVHFDTEDLRLFRWGIVLTRRQGGTEPGWHCAFPAGDYDGDDDELVFPDAKEIPAELRDLLYPLTRDQILVPVAHLRTEQTAHRLDDDSGEPTLTLLDETVSILDGKHVAARFREIELVPLSPEAGRGSMSEAVDDALRTAGAVAAVTTRAATALGPRASAPPDVVESDPVRPEDPAGEAVRAHLAKHIRRFLLQDVRVRRDLPDSVHQMRVAARRIRSGLRGFGPLVDAEWSRHLRTELGWIAGELGAVRDTEVMIERLDERAADLPPDEADLAQTAVDNALTVRITDAREHALGALGSERHHRLLVALVDAAGNPRLTPAADRPCAEALPPLVDKTWRRLAKDVDQLHLDSPAHPWHETRIAAKKARYAAEAVEPVFGRPAKELVRALEQVTEILGDHQDAHVAQMTLRSLATEPGMDAPTGFALGLLYALEVDYEMALRRDFLRLWPKIAKARTENPLT
ncbi:MAG: CHAD domain-containing protein [Candidatus Nanopelagicales bacterium]